MLNPSQIVESRNRVDANATTMPAHRSAQGFRVPTRKSAWGAGFSARSRSGVAATTLLKHYGKVIHMLDAHRAEFSKIDGEGGTDCPGSAHDDEGKNSTAEVRAAARCLRLDHPLVRPVENGRRASVSAISTVCIAFV